MPLIASDQYLDTRYVISMLFHCFDEFLQAFTISFNGLYSNEYITLAMHRECETTWRPANLIRNVNTANLPGVLWHPGD